MMIAQLFKKRQKFIGAIRFRILPILFVLLLTDKADATVHFVDSQGSTVAAEDGSRKFPWTDLNRIIRNGTVKAGDEIILRSGNYGELRIRNAHFSEKVRISVQSGAAAKFTNVIIRDSLNIELDGFLISSSYAKQFKQQQMVEVGFGSKHITISNFNIFSIASSNNWTKDDWNKKAISGVAVNGDNINILYNKLSNVNFGISIHGKYANVIGNTIDGFSGDGLRGLGDYSVFESNVVKNCYAVNGNHDDGFQSWSVSKDGKIGAGIVSGVVLRKNLIIDTTDADRELSCSLQGIGLFGGYYKDWIIENNAIFVDNWHGITIQGAINVRILNNTIVDFRNSKIGPAWIRVADLGVDKKSQNNLVANNLAGKFVFDTKGVLSLQNLLLRNPYDLFEDIENFDFHLRKDSRAIDSGMDGLGVSDDYFGNPRPSGVKIDVGAAELQQ